MSGWIKLHRSITEHWIWKDPVKLKCWLDLLLTVNHTSTKINVGNQIYTCGRGQSIQSLSSWAKRWGVSKDTARNLIVLLEKDGMITRENLDNFTPNPTRLHTPKHTRSITRITVCNYESYQTLLHDELHASRPAADQQPVPNKNNKNGNNDKEKKTKVRSDYSDIDFCFIELEGFKEIFLEWLDYKKTQYKFTYKNERSLKVAYNELVNLSQGRASVASEIVKKSIANGWKGLFAMERAATAPTATAKSAQQQAYHEEGYQPSVPFAVGSNIPDDYDCARGFATGSTL